MDANRAAHLRALVESALQADAAAAAAEAAYDAAGKERDRCRERRRNTVIGLQNALGNSQLVYGNSLVYVSVDGTAIRRVPLERIPVIDQPPPIPPAAAAAKTPPAPLSGGSVPKKQSGK